MMKGVLLLLFLNPGKSDDPSAREFKLLEGNWKIVSAEERGKKIPADEAYLGLIDSVRFTTEKPKHLERRCDVYTVTFDAGRAPKRLTATVAGGEIKGEQMLGIYRLEGDRLTVSWRHGAKDYPAGFKTTAEDDWLTLDLERVTK